MASDNSDFSVTFRGVRGSIPTPPTTIQIEEKLTRALEQAQPGDLKDAAAIQSFVSGLPVEVRGCFGGNSSCVQMNVGGEILIFDAGTGIRTLGLDLMKGDFGKGQGTAHIFFSHTHWDHIQGLPFFTPLFIKGNYFTFNCPFGNLKERLEGQQFHEYFPVPFDAYAADLDFPDLTVGNEVKIGDDIRVSWKEMCHPDKSFSYRVEYKGKSVIYATDAEYKNLSAEELKPNVEFFRDADLLIFDAMYTFGESIEKTDWGHSSTFIGVDLAVDANVKKIVFYHHEPNYSDFKLVDILRQSEKYLKPIAPDSNLQMQLAQEGMTLSVLNGARP